MPTSLQPVISDVLARLRRNLAPFGDQFPIVGQGKKYSLTANDNWLAAFWPGMLWLAAGAYHDDDLRAQAERLLNTFERRLENRVHITHDLGFLYTLSARAQWQITGDEAARQLALQAAGELAGRYRVPGRYIQAWGEVGDPQEGGRIIVDTMLNIPLLFWASEQTGDPRFRHMAVDHANISAEHLVREDASTAHTFFFDQVTGEPLFAKTHQGYADDSMWARGQAWAIFGFATAAQWTGCEEYRDLAVRLMERFMSELPEDGVSRWDLRLPATAAQHPDTSASAIAAAGMLRLEKLLGGDAAAAARANAVRLVDALLAQYAETDPEGQGLLRGGTYHAHKQLGVNEYFICGDYYFLEALLMLDGTAPDFWGPIHS